MQIKTEDLIILAGSALTVREEILVKMFAPMLLKIFGKIFTKLFPNIANKIKGVNVTEALELAKEYDKAIQEEEQEEADKPDVPISADVKGYQLINLNEYDFSKMNMKYFRKEDVLDCKEDFSITGEYTWIHINDSHHISHKVVDNKYKATGHVPFVIDENGYVHRGGHSGNDICSSFKKKDFTVNFTGKVKYYFVCRCSFEFAPKSNMIHSGILLGISNILEVK